QKLQAALHAKAEAEAGYRFYALYDKISRDDILAHAYAQCRSNKSLPLRKQGARRASSDGASLVRPWLRFHTPLIEPDMPISRIRLSDKTSRLHPRRAATKRC